MAFKLNQRKEFNRHSISGVKVGGYDTIDVEAVNAEAKALGTPSPLKYNNADQCRSLRYLPVRS